MNMTKEMIRENQRVIAHTVDALNIANQHMQAILNASRNASNLNALREQIEALAARSSALQAQVTDWS